MQDSTLQKVRRGSSYVGGGALIALGILGLLVEFSGGKSSSIFFGYVLGASLVICGGVICVATRAHYGGGLWSFCGLIFVAAATVRFAFVLDAHVGGRQLLSPGLFYSKIAALWGVGCYCLIWGHMRHHQKKKSLHRDA